ncbi:MAG TPA: hypothetical protein VIT92_17460 [Burkholderiaceae bacterium]
MRSALYAFALAAVASTATAAPAIPVLADQQRDLDYARTEYVQKSPAFSPAQRQRAERYIAQLQARRQVLGHAEFLAAALRIAAFAENGHDAVDVGDGAWWPDARLPVRTLWMTDGIVVARAAPAQHALLGATVTAIEGRTPAVLLKQLRRYGGGTDAYNAWNMNWVIETAGMLHAMGLAAQPDRLRLSLRLADGRTLDRSIAFVPNAEVPGGGKGERWWAAPLTAGEQARGWRAATDSARDPLYVQQPDQFHRSVDLQELDALYIQLRINVSVGEQQLAPFVAQLRQRLREAPPRNLILDLRMDIGGDNEQTLELMRDIAAKVPGKIYVLTGPHTFSAGIANAATLKHAAGQRAIIVGEASGDRLRWWSESRPVTLPASRVQFHLNGGYWDLIAGCKPNPLCYSDKYDSVVGRLAPQIAAPIRVADWLAGRDPGMAAVERDLRAQR